ncbi:Phospholipase-like protein [Corchorus capsularis]|uniref:Phospholipase-like protein n=1 Tax=Corchorus capsularis TaxID=210143 RepID=A0A1R3JCR8_COCAP|nr:Phospholipase-like protein [Corchorus capsularis]
MKRKKAAAPTFASMERRVTRSEAKRRASILAAQEGSVQTPAVSGSAQNSTCNSFGLTEIISLLGRNVSHQVDELDEVQSDLRVSIGPGYRVKEAYASTLRKIIEKHGDIAMNCTLKSDDNRTIFLEKLCQIVQKLQSTKLLEITDIQVKKMLDDVIDLKEAVNFDVGWLVKNLEEVLEALELVNRLKVWKDRNVKNIEESVRALKGYEDLIHVYEDTLKELKEKASFEKEKLDAGCGCKQKHPWVSLP